MPVVSADILLHTRVSEVQTGAMGTDGGGERRGRLPAGSFAHQELQQSHQNLCTPETEFPAATTAAG